MDSSEDLVKKINTKKGYKVTSYGDTSTNDNSVEKITALHTGQEEHLRDILNRAYLVTTSVGPNNLAFVAESLNKYIEKKVDFIAFENMHRASSYVVEQEERLSEIVQQYDVVVDKIIPLQDIDNLDLVVEDFGSVVFDQSQYKRRLLDLDTVVSLSLIHI